MDEYYLLTKHWKKFIGVGAIIVVFFLFILLFNGSASNEETVTYYYFDVPFASDVSYGISSEFGTRFDPIDTNLVSFHEGIDLVAPEGTSILASADGTIYEVGSSEYGLGNYVYIEHNFEGLILYSIYGHMLDNSIVVQKGDVVNAGDKIGTIGSSGRSTGIHLHFMISKDKISFEKDDLIDPGIIFKGTNY